MWKHELDEWWHEKDQNKDLEICESLDQSILFVFWTLDDRLSSLKSEGGLHGIFCFG